MTTTDDATESHNVKDRAVDALTPPDVAEPYEEGEAWLTFTDFEVNDLEHATWAARKLGRLQVRADESQAVYDHQRVLLDEWLAAEQRTLLADARFFEGLLRGYHERRLAENPKLKTVKLPDGTHLRSQAGKLSVEVVELEAFERWAAENDVELELLRFPEHGEPNKAEIATRYGAKAEGETEPGSYPAVIPETGETVPGVLIKRGERSFTISLAPKQEDDE